jgi:hypothetical protein
MISTPLTNVKWYNCFKKIIRIFGKEMEKPRKDRIRNHVKYTICKILPTRNTVPAVVLALEIEMYG